MSLRRFSIALLSTLAFACLIGLSGPAHAQTPLVVEWKTNFKFGTVAASVDGGGTIVIPPNQDTRNISGQLVDFGGTVKRGKIKITGEPRTWVVITLPSSIVIQKGTSSHTMTITNLTMNTNNPVKLNKNGVKNVFIGGTLTVTTDQRQGTYKNTSFVINVEYL